MSDARTVARNTIYLTIAQAILILAGILSMKLTTTSLQTTGYGLFGYAMSLTTIAFSFMDLGLGTLATRELSRKREETGKYLSNLLSIRVIIAVLILLVLNGAVYLGLIPAEAQLVVIIVSLASVFNVLTALFVSVFQAFERMEFIALQTTLTSILTLLAAATMAFFGLDVVGYAILYCVAYFIVFGVCLVICVGKFSMLRPSFDLGFWKSAIADALPFGITYLISVIFYQISTMVLQLTQSWEDVGIFRAPFNLFMTILFVPQVLSTALFPAMSRYYVTSRGSFKNVINKFLKYIILIAIPMGVGTTVLADKIMYTLSDSQYADSILVLQILIWAAVCLFIGSVYITIMNSADRQRTTTEISFVCLVGNVVLNVLLIPAYSYVGAAVAITVTELFQLAIYAYACTRLDYGISKDLFRAGAKIIAAGVLMGGFLYYFHGQNLAILVILGAVIYFAIVYALGTFDREDVDIIRQIIGSRINLSKRT